MKDEALLFKLIGATVIVSLLLIGLLSTLDRTVPESLAGVASAGIGALAMAARSGGSGSGSGSDEKDKPDAG